MKLIIFLTILLISNTFSSVYIGRNEEKTLYSNGNTDYIYIYLDQFKSYDTVYLSIEIKYGSLSEIIGYLYSDSDNPSTSYFNTLTSFGKTETSSKICYYYKMDYRNFNYLIIKYNVYTISTLVTIQTYDSNPLSFIFIIVGCVVGGIILIAIIVVVIICYRRKKRIRAMQGTINPIPTSPIMPNNPQYVPGYDQNYLYPNQPQYQQQAPVEPNLYQSPK